MPSPDCSLTRKRRGVGALLVTAIAASLAVWQSPGSASPAHGMDADADTVVLQLDTGGARSGGLATMWRDLQRQPDNAGAAASYANQALQRYARDGDARYIGFAQGALEPWRDNPQPPLAIWLLRGRILQTQHQFAAAGTDLDRLLATHRDAVEGMLLSADAWRRAGDIGRARARCAGVALAGYPIPALHCAGDILMSLGEPEQAFATLSQVHEGPAHGPPPLQQWMLTVAAEAAAAAGKVHEELELYQRALAIPGATIALHASHADLLLAQGRPKEALVALTSAPAPDTDALLLRRAIAAKRLDHADRHALRDRLSGRFAEAERLGTAALHWREQAMFALRVADDPDTALAYAKQNWAVQKGPEDASLLLEAARAAGRPEAAEIIYGWREQQRQQDI